jgi:hypothetical protein
MPEKNGDGGKNNSRNMKGKTWTNALEKGNNKLFPNLDIILLIQENHRQVLHEAFYLT